MKDVFFESIDELISEYEKVKAERDAAVLDFSRIAKTGDGYCHVCTGGIGGACIHKDDYIDISCGDCRACVCAECLESAGSPNFNWRGPQNKDAKIPGERRG